MHPYDEVVKECTKLEGNDAEVEKIGLSRHGNMILLATMDNVTSPF
jgi:hypothetical protein